MVARVMAVANQKGGVGKTTTTVNLAASWAAMKRRVLLVDMDPQGNATTGLGIEKHGQAVTLSDVLLGEASVEDILEELPSGNLDVLPGSPETTTAEIELMNLAKREYRLKSVLEPLLERYDYVLIDCPPSLGRKLVAALVMSTHVACPVKLSGFAVDGVEGLLNTIIGVREAYNQDLEILGIVINDMDRSVNHDKALKALENTVPDLLFENKIMHRPPLDTATTDGVPVWELRYGHVAAKEVEAVLEELLEKVG